MGESKREKEIQGIREMETKRGREAGWWGVEREKQRPGHRGRDTERDAEIESEGQTKGQRNRATERQLTCLPG